MKFTTITLPKILLLAFLIQNTIQTQLKKEEHSILNYLTSLYSKKHHSETPVKTASKLSTRTRVHSFMEKAESLSQLRTNNSTESTESKGEEKNADILSAWLSISSFDFANTNGNPAVYLPNKTVGEIKYDDDYFRINEIKTNSTDGKPNTDFFFRMNKDHIYYSATEEDINVLGAMDLNAARLTQRSKISNNCFDLIMKNFAEYRICAKDQSTRDRWYCSTTSRLNIVDLYCENRQKADFKPTFVVDQQVVQPIILIPSETPQCNKNFDYARKGADWECQCKEGREQSPIDINTKKVLSSPAIPVFSFTEVEAISPITSLDGTMIAKQHIKIKYFSNAIRIFHTNFGKVVSLDGTVYHAEEIVFHTPAEHTLDGVRHEMEMQVIAYGQSKGDIAKQVVISFLFEQKPGVYREGHCE
jgi:Eukaryotic-type carbonic anhydrase